MAKFKDIAIGANFFDPMSGENWTKETDLTAHCTSGGDAFEGETDVFGPDDEVEAE